MANQEALRTGNSVPTIMGADGSETRRISADSTGQLKATSQLRDSEGNTVSSVNPIQTSVGWVYGNEVNTANSSVGNFSGTIKDFFVDLTTTSSDVTSNNPKTIVVALNRPIEISAVGFGCDDGGQSFSNISFDLLGSNNEVIFSKNTFATDNTKRNSQIIKISPTFCTKVRINFNTTDPIGLSNIGLREMNEVKASLQAVNRVTGAVEDIKSLGGALDVHRADVHDIIYRGFLHQPTGASDTTNGVTPAGSTTILLNDATGFNAGDFVETAELETESELFPKILSISTNTLNLDRPIDKQISSGATVEAVKKNMNVLGTIGSPQIFKIEPPAGSVYHITSIIVFISDATGVDLDDTQFGALASLTNGCVLRENKSTGFHTLGNWKNHGDIALQMFDVTYPGTTGGANKSVRAIWTFENKVGGIIKLDGDVGDTLELLVQDDLTGLVEFSIQCEGHLQGQTTS